MRGAVLLKTDSYKVTHWRQYPPGTTGVYSYLESRGGQWPTSVFFGLQYLLREYFVGPVVTRAGIDEAEAFFAEHFGDRSLFNREGWEHEGLVSDHGGHAVARDEAHLA
jgi:nicotinamide phosphoribosyltransferase